MPVPCKPASICIVPAGPPTKSGGDSTKLFGNETAPLPSDWATARVGVDVPFWTSSGTFVDTVGSFPETASTCKVTTGVDTRVPGVKTMICTSTEAVADPAGPSGTVRPEPSSARSRPPRPRRRTRSTVLPRPAP